MTLNHFHLWPRLHARPVAHVRPPSPDQWRDVEGIFFDCIENEIQRRQAGGDPADAPWSRPRYFDAGSPDGNPALRLLVVLQHLSDTAVTQLIAMSHLLRRQWTTVQDTPGTEDTAGACDHTGPDVELRAHTRRGNSTSSPADTDGPYETTTGDNHAAALTK